MSTQSQRLDDCPYCGSEIRGVHVLIEYDSEESTAYWADCPECGEVVDPE